MGQSEPVERFCEFLIAHAKDGTPFSIENVVDATGWKPKTARTYVSKQIKALIKRRGGQLYVKDSIKYLTVEQFVDSVSQKEQIVPNYQRVSYENVVVYEFLMPLTKEDSLRRHLDRLFYRNTLEDQITLIGPDEFKDAVPKVNPAEPQDKYASRIASIVAGLFGGYSITHVNGRFRAAKLTTQYDSVGKRYIIDETTAVVRFIVPCASTKKGHGERFDVSIRTSVDDRKLQEEIQRIRLLFLKIFAEVVVHSVQGEDEIWLIESAANQTKLYVWEKGN